MSARYASVCRLIGCAAGFLTVEVAGAAMPSWTQHQGDAAHSGHVAVVVDPAEIKPLWSLTREQLGVANLKPGTVTDAGRVYLSAAKGSGTFQVLAMDRTTGSVTWSRDFVPYGSDLSAPSVGNGKVYVHQWGHSGTSGGNAAQYPYLFGLNAATGATQFATSHSGQWSSGSRPTVAGTQVFAAGGYYGGMDAYNGVAGGLQWSAAANQQYGWIPAADAAKVYVYMGSASASPGPHNGTLYAYDRATGARTSIVNSDDTFTRYNGTVFLGGQNDALVLTNGSAGTTLVSFNLANGTVRWRSAGNYLNSVAFDDGTVFAANGIELSLLDQATGAKVNQWFAPAGQALAGNLLVTDNLIFAQTGASTFALDRQTLQTVWSTNVTGDLALGDDVLMISNASRISVFSVVPEPTTLAVLAGAGIVLVRRRHVG